MFAPIHDATHKQDGLVIPPGDDGNSATCSSEPETPNNDDLKLLAKEDGMAKLTIFFEYFDTSGNLYTSQICLLLKQRAVNITTVSMCPTENKIQ
jgi:hypothetical protein